MKTCLGCNQELPLDAYGKYPASSKPSLRGKYHARCRKCKSFDALVKHFERRYGITMEQYDTMYAAQQGKCLLCGEDGEKRLENGRPRLHVDHDHMTGHVRGLLCNTCNWKVGILETTPPPWWTKARRYIDAL